MCVYKCNIFINVIHLYSFIFINVSSLAYIFHGLQSIRTSVTNWKGAQALELYRPNCKSASPTNILCDFRQIFHLSVSLLFIHPLKWDDCLLL